LASSIPGYTILFRILLPAMFKVFPMATVGGLSLTHRMWWKIRLNEATRVSVH